MNLITINPVFICSDLRKQQSCSYYKDGFLGCDNCSGGYCISEEAIAEAIKGTEE